MAIIPSIDDKFQIAFKKTYSLLYLQSFLSLQYHYLIDKLLEITKRRKT